MKHIHFEAEKDGFYGAYWQNKKPVKDVIIAMIGDDAEDYMAISCVKWLQRQGVNVLTMSPAKKNYSHHNYPLERIEKAIGWLKDNGNDRIGIVGASTTGTLALVAASYFPDITLTMAMTPSDFVWQGFEQGKKGRLSGMAGGRGIPVYLSREAFTLYAVLLSASGILAYHQI